ncbi:MAG: anti-sigma factor [Vicinamibacterales bacterium]
MTTKKAPARRGSAPRAADPCRHAAADLWAYLDDELSPSRSAAMARHLASCAPCRRAARRLRALMEACRAQGRRPLPRAVRQRAVARARSTLRRSRS